MMFHIYDSARSIKQADAAYFMNHHRLVIMTLGEQHDDEISIIHNVDFDIKAIGQLLKDKFKTDYVATDDWI